MLRLIRGASREDDMDARELFLDQHAAMHSAAVGGNRMSAAERTFAGLTDEQMCVRPREDLIAGGAHVAHCPSRRNS